MTIPARQPRRVSLIRAYGMVLGFALGQVGPFIPGAVRPRPPIVRDVESEHGPGEFHPLERIDPATVLTIPLETQASPGARVRPGSAGRFDLN
ncbi:MAG TPA: hypothetical protein VGT61_09105 [Thermomicrobiales bacterium]|jgi:hypothetical protein|nr:hypothetical protein [Thermomicrobiales bacterium]